MSTAILSPYHVNFSSMDDEPREIDRETVMVAQDDKGPPAVESRPSDNGDESDHSVPVVEDESDLIVAHMDELLNEESDAEELPLAGSPVGLTAISDDSTPAGVPLGGLDNLGNTCYMASSLQMLASIESFVEAIRNDVPTRLSDEERKLRTSFVNLMERLGQGETARPDEFKEAVDERSFLFAGFRQQDSHEFVTTLLDLLDEDYKRKALKSIDEDTEMKDVDVGMIEEVENDCKPAPVREHPELLSMIDTSVASSSQSFLELDVNAIDQLLHGAVHSREVMIMPASMTLSPPRCKLVGGRMNTTDATLTPYTMASRKMETINESPAESSSTQADVEMDALKNDSSHVPDGPAVDSPIDAFFTTEARIRLTCDSCKYTRSHRETFLHLSLEIGAESCSVEDGLRRFLAPEKREIKCERCFAESATQMMEITKLPRAMLLHFKRFIVDVSDDYSSVSYRKNRSAVSFENQLSLDRDLSVLGEYLSTDVVLPETTQSLRSSYAIRSVVNHIGSSASCGHYTADAHRIDQDAARQWIRFNDSYVSRISEQQAIGDAKSTAYMVLYELE